MRRYYKDAGEREYLGDIVDGMGEGEAKQKIQLRI